MADNHHTPTTMAVMHSLKNKETNEQKNSFYTDLTSEDKVPHQTSSREIQRGNM